MSITQRSGRTVRDLVILVVFPVCLGAAGLTWGESQPEGVTPLEYRVERSVLVREANPAFCWFHPRAAAAHRHIIPHRHSFIAFPRPSPMEESDMPAYSPGRSPHEALLM
jgi:hypothetical protein